MRMGWRPTQLTREQMEERRLQGGKLLREGRLTKAEIAHELGVSRMAVSQWAERMKSDGMTGLSRRRALGQPTKLDKAKQKKLKQIIRQARADGYTMVDQELEAGVRSCGVPIRDRQGRIFAALNASGHASRVNCEELKTRFLPVLLDAAGKISASLAR